MAISCCLGFACKFYFPIRLHQLHLGKPRFSCSAAVIETLDDPDGFVKESSCGFNSRSIGKANEKDRKAPEWKKLSAKQLGFSSSLIAKPTRKVLNALRRKGYEVYLVGGCVRDLILKQTPKDFDILTSAELKEVMRTFSRCEIVGRRFPICHVHVGEKIVEVSSFSTSARNFSWSSKGDLKVPIGVGDEDYARWRNSLHRDFTINALMYDPYAKLVYDYMGGLEDIKKGKVRTIIRASSSFQEDCARILRAIRIASRLGFRLSKETAYFIKHLSHSLLRLDKGRIMMEMNYMLAYGSAEASLRLLWKIGLLEILLPIQAAYFVGSGFGRRDKRTNMLLSLFSNLDKLLAPDRPCHSCLWVAILAFHKALSDQPRDPSVVAAFSLAVHNGGHMSEAVKISRRISRPYDNRFQELLEPQKFGSQAFMQEIMDLAESVKVALCEMTDEQFISQAMGRYPKAPISDLVFFPLALYLNVRRVFECVTGGEEKRFMAKQGSKIDYDSLALGRIQEVRHVFARVVFDTIFPLKLAQDSTFKSFKE